MTEEDPTYHGVPIPEEFWLSWNDPISSGVVGFRIGVTSALGIPVDDDRNWQEIERLKKLAEMNDQARQAAWQEQYDRDMIQFRKRNGQ